MVAEGEIEEGKVVAVLRSDGPTPLLSIWDATLDSGIAPEYLNYAQETSLCAQLQGDIGVSRMAFHIELQELAGLIALLQEVTGLNLFGMEWATYQRTLEIQLDVQTQHFGPPVRCVIWLRVPDNEGFQEEHHSRFVTNLTYVATFLGDLEHIAYQYKKS